MRIPKRSLLPALATAVLLTGMATQALGAKQGQARVDSLRAALAVSQEDTARVDLLNHLSKHAGWEIGDYDTSSYYARTAQALAVKLGYKKGIAAAYRNFGVIAADLGDSPAALKNYFSALGIFKEIGDLDGVARCHNNIGNGYADQGNYPEALKNFFASLRIYEQKGDQRGAAKCSINIGNVYMEQGSYEDALKSYLSALEIDRKIGDKIALGHINGNIASTYAHLGDHSKAQEYQTAALRLKEETDDKPGLAEAYLNLGGLFAKQGRYTDALKSSMTGLGISEGIGDRKGMVNGYVAIGQLQLQAGRAAEARAWLNKARALSIAIGRKFSIQQSYQGLAKADSALGDHRSSLAHYKLAVLYRDSLFNEENTKQTVRTQMQYEFDKKEAAAQAEQEKKDAATQAEQEKKDQRARLVRNGIAGGLGFALIFLTVVWRQRNKINTARKRSDELLLNILPEEVAEELKTKGEAEAKYFDTATILFTDFKGFTQLSEKVTPAELVAELNTCFKEFDRLMEKYGIEKIKTIGDAYMAAGGLPDPEHGSPSDVVQAALEMQAFMKRHKVERQAAGKPYFEMRVGVHTGPVVAGIVGVKKFQYDIWGDTVNTASRMESSGEVGQVNISEATYQLVSSQSAVGSSPAFVFTPRGKVQAKGKGELEMYFVQRSSMEA